MKGNLKYLMGNLNNSNSRGSLDKDYSDTVFVKQLYSLMRWYCSHIRCSDFLLWNYSIESDASVFVSINSLDHLNLQLDSCLYSAAITTPQLKVLNRSRKRQEISKLSLWAKRLSVTYLSPYKSWLHKLI